MTNFKRGQCRNIVSLTYQVFGQFFLRSKSCNSKDLKCVRRRRPSVVCGLCQLIPMYVHDYVNTVQYYFTK